MGLKKSVFLSDETIEHLTRLSKNKDSVAWSAGVNIAVTNMAWLATKSLPELDKKEWQEIGKVYANNDTLLEIQPYRVASDMMEHYSLIDVDEHPMPALVKRIHGMNQAEQFAILYMLKVNHARNE